MRTITLSVDAMGGDHGLDTSLGGIARYIQTRDDIHFIVHGDADKITQKLVEFPQIASKITIAPAEFVISEGMKAAASLRQGRGSSMWNAIGSVLDGDADAVISAGNTGALMALSIARLKRIKGIRRPALTALWPTPTGMSVVLDVGANLHADSDMLCEFALLGHAYAKAMLETERPRVGLLNVGREDQKGGEDIQKASAFLQAQDYMNYIGYVEGDSISEGFSDVVVTNGFSGNAALKAGEGVARLVAGFVKDALTQNMLTKTGAVLAVSGLRGLKERMDPANVNAGVMLGLKGVVVKSHGGANAKGFATSIKVAHKVAEKGVLMDIANLLNAPKAKS